MLHHHHRNVVAFDRIGQGHERPVPRRNLGRQVVIDPVADVADPGGNQMLGRVEGLGQARAEPAQRALAGKPRDGGERALDHRRLVLFVVDRPLLVAVAHELPAGVQAGLRHARVVDAHARVDRQGRADAKALIERVKAPEAHAHAVLVPAPVGHVGQRGHARGRRQHLPRHRAGDVPHLQIDDGPDDDARMARQLHHRPVDDGGIVHSIARLRHADGSLLVRGVRFSCCAVLCLGAAVDAFHARAGSLFPRRRRSWHANRGGRDDRYAPDCTCWI